MASRNRNIIARLGRARLAYLFLLPALAHYTIFTAYPIINGLRVGFYEWDGLSPVMTFVGFSNIRKVLMDELVWTSLGNNALISAAMVIVSIPLAIALALALGGVAKRLQTLVITILFVPTLLSLVVVAIIFRFFFEPNFGKVNSALRSIGLDRLALNWLGSMDPILGIGSVALFTVIAVMLWHSYGMRMVLYHAALKTMPPDLYDAARIDGANGWQEFRFITWPLLWPLTSMLIVLTVIGSMQVFDIIFVMTGGGPIHATETMGTYIYKQAFQVLEEYQNFGYSVSISFVLFIIIASLTLINLKVLRGRRDY